MSPIRVGLTAALVLISSLCGAQIDSLTIAAGTPEDKDLTTIGNEQDLQKKMVMFQDFLQKYSSNPMAVAFGNWQLAQTYQSAGDLPKAVDAGDKALASSPRNLDILSTLVAISQQMHDGARVFNYSLQGGGIYLSIDKQTKPENTSDESFRSTLETEKQNNQNAFQFFQASAFSVIETETSAKTRMGYIEQFTATFPQSGLDDQLTSYAMMSLAEMQDNKRLIAYGEKAIAANPDNMVALLTLATTYVQTAETGAKAIPHAQKVILLAKADQPGATKSNKVSAGVAHCVVGRAYALQEKTQPSIAELKTATSLLKGEDEQQYAIATYYLGWNYAKLKRLSEARAILSEGAAIPGSMQGPIKELLTKVNSARAAGK
jgi:tetratricopeptide (TPR) repeat protein